MSKQYFLDVEEVLQVIMSELPAGVYAEDLADDPNPDNRSFSSSELRAHAQMLSGLYALLSDINKDKFITTATDNGLTKWEKELFKEVQNTSLSPETRRQKLLSKLRSAGGINYPTIYNIVKGILGSIDFDILPYSGQNSGAWLLDESPLGLSTWLSKIDPIYGYLLDNDLDYVAAGLTLQQLQDIQEVAYTYEVRIYGTADAQTLVVLDQQLTQFEPARSTHVIRNGQVRPSV